MWLITLLILAAIAFIIVKYVTGKASQQDSGTPAAQIQDDHTPTEKNVPPALSETTESSPNSKKVSSSVSELAVDTGDMQNDVREMIKILNLAPSDASRLSISREVFSALLTGDTAHAPSADQLNVAAAKLRHMLA
ncbi:MAG: hypothetical protein ACI9UN_004041 [Granulosicoccus sp.]|jgi:hypothetical protein